MTLSDAVATLQEHLDTLEQIEKAVLQNHAGNITVIHHIHDAAQATRSIQRVFSNRLYAQEDKEVARS